MPLSKRKDKSGEYKGRHYTEYVNEVKNLKRQGRLNDATALLLELVDAAEAEAKAEQWSVAPWYYEQLALIYRGQKDYAAEVSILERYCRQPRGPKDRLTDRLQKARALRDSEKA